MFHAFPREFIVSETFGYRVSQGTRICFYHILRNAYQIVGETNDALVCHFLAEAGADFLIPYPDEIILIQLLKWISLSWAADMCFSGEENITASQVRTHVL